jgi:hypothetical protein
MAFYRNGKLVYDFQKDGKFYKKTKTKDGEQSLCQMVQCRCGGWASVKLVNRPTHMANKQHTEWAKKHGQKVVQRYKKKGKQQEKPDFKIDTSTLFFDDQKYCSIFNFVTCDFDDYTEGGWWADSRGLSISFNVGGGDPSDHFLEDYFFDERFYEREQKQIYSSSISQEGLTEILYGYNSEQPPKSPHECLFKLIHYHLFREFCLQSFDPETKTFDESITDAVDDSGMVEDTLWKQIHQTIDDQLQGSGIIASSSLEELYNFALSLDCIPTTQRECILTLLKHDFVSGSHAIDSELLANILTVAWR